MRKMIWVLAGVFLITGSASAQEAAPRAELSAGYSYLRLGGSGGTNQNGGTFSIAGNLNPWVGIVGDFGYYHSSPFGVGLNTKTFLFGPRLTARSIGKVEPFFQVLVGGAHLSAGLNGVSASITPFTVSAGTGIDIKASRHVAFRPQIDYIALRSNGGTTNAIRASFGVVFRFGSQ
jgi:Outer membrane protein beta-barrel domain